MTPALLIPHTILMPMENLVAMDETQVRFALRHELMHYKRRDHLVSVLLSVLQAVYWFNPFVWLAFRQMRLDMEVACDNAVVKTMSSREKSGYALLILSLFTRKTCQRVLGLAQGNAKRVAEKRIRGIYMDEKSRPAVKAVSVIVTMLLLVGCFTTACQPVTAQPAPTDSSTGIFTQPTQSVAATQTDLTGQSATPTATQAAAATPASSDDLSPTTGLPGNKEYRPVQVQIDNEATGRPQYGIQAGTGSD
jgi:bla regulator protein BlaR1